ncbi:methyltetrahydrofolate cobalamin methyltransferase [Mahella australiensis]|uniref:Methionine synthase n=1 Tax=Mahella australiensis (strain DSM 15567 / CIP 107919 / 50-1 BON) TaxID=697281 RepID=F4A348_MAHA5|nr:methyltetrahydrofolate cobalamin methyltransferase [Mahella australiensis]AEE96281.1 Methionine synthase [Mahella australiensis 50-1 BON]
MIIIGEKINTSIKAIRPAVENQDAGVIQEVALKQVEAGAHYIDVNCGTFPTKEPELLQWLVETVQQVTDKPLCIDSPNPNALKKALAANKNGKPLVNSITAEKERYDAILPLIVEYDTSVVALCMDDSGMPETADERLAIAERLVESLNKEGIKLEDIYFDPMVRPVGTGSHYGVVALDTISRIMKEFPGVHTTCGLSNISFGLPGRKLINQAFLILAIGAGLDSAILDPLDKRIMSFVYAAELLKDKDPYCLNYITAFREGRLDI